MRPLLTVLREPLIHFLALGACIFALNAVLHPPAREDGHRIEVTAADIARIRALYAQQWGAAPDGADMPRLVDNYIRSEVLFREGTRLGLGTEDSILRNRITQKMEFLLEDASSIPQPADVEMQAYLDAHAAAFRIPERIGFAQLYFSPELRGARAEADAKSALAALRDGTAAERGDPLMIGSDPAPRSASEIAEDYGEAFARELFAVQGSGWQGPIRSAFGLHLVRVLERQPARTPALAEIRAQVHDALMVDRLRQANEEAYARLRARYQVVIDPGALKPAGKPLAAR